MEPERTTPESHERDEKRTELNEPENKSRRQEFTDVPNAHSSGVGAMGRNDEKLPTAENGEEQRPDPAY